MRVLVTGGAGFIGSHLVDMLVDLGHEVLVFDNHSTGNPLNLMRAHQRGARTVAGSVAWMLDIHHAMDRFKPEVVFHLAAQIDVRVSADRPEHDATVNVIGTVNTLEAAREAGVHRFVFVSSAAIFGDIHIFPNIGPDTAPQPISPYGASKAAAELYVKLYDRQAVDGLHNLCTTTVVLSNVYGPRQRPGAGAVNIFARALLAGEPVTLYGDGKNVRDYVFVTDAARALCWAAGVLTPGHGMGHRERTLLGTGVGTTDIDLLNLIRRETGGDLVEQWEPARPCDIRSMVFRAGHGMTPTTLADGVRITVQELRKELKP